MSKKIQNILKKEKLLKMGKGNTFISETEGKVNIWKRIKNDDYVLSETYDTGKNDEQNIEKDVSFFVYGFLSIMAILLLAIIFY